MRELHTTFKTPETCFSSLRKCIPPYIRLTFAAAVVLGLVTHLYAFTNKLPNLDDTLYLFGTTYGRGSGRWLLPTVLLWDGSYSMPWLIGVLSIFCIAAAACLTVQLLRIRGPLACIIAAGILVAFPSTAETFSYTFSADSYFLSLALAAFGAYAAVSFPKGINFAVGSLAVTLSMGIYQSYFSVAAALMVGALIFETLEGKRSLSNLLFRSVMLAGTLFTSLLLYLLLVRVSLPSGNLTPYMGISEMGHISIQELPARVLLCYGKYYMTFWKNDSHLHFTFLRYAFALTALCSVALLVWIIRKKRLAPLQTILIILLVLLYPLAGDLIYVMAPHSPVYMRMIYGLCYILLAPLALVDFAAQERKPEFEKSALQTAASWIILLTMALTAYSYVIHCNKAYFKIDLSRQQCASYSTRLLERIEACEGYTSKAPVILVGSTGQDLVNPTPELGEVVLDGIYDFPQLRRSYSYGIYLRDYMGFPNPVQVGNSNEALALEKTEEVSNMPVYPAAGSIQVIEGAVVVKLDS